MTIDFSHGGLFFEKEIDLEILFALQGFSRLNLNSVEDHSNRKTKLGESQNPHSSYPMFKKLLLLAIPALASVAALGQQSVTSLTLIDADTDLPVAAYDPILSGTIIDLNALPTRNVNIRANSDPDPVGSVKFGYDGNLDYQIESVPPYAFAKDVGGNYFSWTPRVGPHTVTATSFTGASATGTQGTTLTVNFTVIDSAVSLTLINADTDLPIAGYDPFLSGTSLDLNALPTRNLNIRADSDPNIGSIKFGYDSNSDYQIESVPPYAFAKDVRGNFFPWTPRVGSHRVTATPFMGISATGTEGKPLTVDFTVIDSAVTGIPLANAGPDQNVILPTTSIVLNGSGTNINGTITGYAWTQLSGPSTATLANEGTPSLTASALILGTYNFRLTVTDNQNNSHSDDVFVIVSGAPSAASVLITGELKRWHKITLTLDGPAATESATPNPFTDYQFDVIFTHPGSGLTYRTPGYFAADGDAANTSATSGNKWRAHLSPDEIGSWNYQIVFRQGTNAATSGLDSGTPVLPYHNFTGSFSINENDKTAPDFRARGRLQYVNKHHLRFKGDGTYFIKAGSDSPENLLAYNDIDDTPNTGDRLKSWLPHAADYIAGDPSWAGGKGTELIGAVNYIASEGLNVMSFLTYSYNGDDKNVFPHATAGDYTRMDCSKLDQWEIIFTHMQCRGIYLHFKTQETENDQDFDGGALGNQRRLYYRELVARYGHHLALNWNIGEENSNTNAQRKEFAQWFYENDPYRHNVVIHSAPDDKDTVYTPLRGDASRYTGVSLQSIKLRVFADTLAWRTNSAATSQPWVVANDEQGLAIEGIKADVNDPAHDAERADVLWGNIMAGGAGIESYFGFGQPETDLTLQDFRSRDLWWDQCRHALRFLSDNSVPFWEMSNTDNLVSNSGNNANHCLSIAGRSYVVYLRNGGDHTLNLANTTGNFYVDWYNPRTGGALVNGPTVSGGGTVALGSPPDTVSSDWVALIEPVVDLPEELDPFSAWADGATFTDDSNNDGVNNGLAWLLGAANKDTNVRDKLPTVTRLSSGELKLSFSMLGSAARGSAALQIEHSSDLGISDPWTSVVVPETSGGQASGVNFVVSPGATTNTVEATISPSQGNAGKLFARVKAQR